MSEDNNIVFHNHHLIPKHAGGTDHPDNIVRVNVAMHAFLHKQLWEQYGNQKDKLAWLGLSGMLTNLECHKEAMRIGYENGLGRLDRKGKTLEQIWGIKKAKEIRKKKSKCYVISHPCGKEEITDCLSLWCKEKKITYKRFYKATIERSGKCLGYRARLFSE